MRYRWMGGILLTMAVTLGACAPQQGADVSDEPSPAPASSAPATTAPTASPESTDGPGASESPEASEDAEPAPTPYDY